MSRILVTGAQGFVGSAILRRLIADGQEVVALSSSREEGQEDAVQWRRMDLLQAGETEIAHLVRQEGIGRCVHSAWYTNHVDYLTADINPLWVDATLRLEAGFRQGGGGRFVGLGTCVEYDLHGRGGRLSEERTPLRPDTLYAQSKVATFRRLSERAAEQGGDFAWARLFFVYGPGDRAGRLIPYLVTSLLEGRPVKARFGGLVRDYIHVDDLAAQIVRITQSNVQGPINTGTGLAGTLADIFTLAGRIAGRPDLVEVTRAVDDAQGERIEPDMTRFETLIGPAGTRSLRDGLTQLFEAGR